MVDSATTALRAEALPAPSTAYRWTVLIFVSLAMFGNYYFYDALSPLADILQKQLGFSDQNIGRLNSFYSIAPIATVLIGGVIIDRIGTRKATLLFGTTCLLGAILTATTPRFEVMAAGRFIFGMGAESLIVSVTTALAKWFRGKELSFAFGINLVIARFGTLLAQSSPSWAGSAYRSWQTPWLIGVGFVTLCVVGPILYWILEVRAERHYHLGQAGEVDKVVAGDILKFGRSYWLLVALCVVFYSAIFPFETFAVKFFQHKQGMPLSDAGLLLSILTACTMVGTPLFGLLADRVGKRALLMIFGSALLIPVFSIMGYAHSNLLVNARLPWPWSTQFVAPIHLVASMAMMGVAFSLVPAVIWPSVAYIVDQKTLGTALGLMTMIQNAGMAFFNDRLGKANDMAHAGATNPSGYLPMLHILTALAALGVVFALLLRRRETGPHGHGLETITTRSSA
ncbi:MAG TPA: MFS transporter [Terriglobales bacterium]|jgi:MFS family permease|nr:MFS transporter [Terriglobales bacterium]